MRRYQRGDPLLAGLLVKAEVPLGKLLETF